ncbi:ankyrin, partial [Anaeromyces robustus]
DYLIQHGADVNKLNNYKVSPILLACKNGYLEIVKCLVQHGADFNRSSDRGITPIIIACRNGYSKIVEFLLENKATIEINNPYRKTLL